MAQEIEIPEAPAKLTVKLKLKGPVNLEAETLQGIESLPKASNEKFLLTILEDTKVGHLSLGTEQWIVGYTSKSSLQIDYEAAAQRLGINKATCRMRLIRLQQQHGFKKVGAKRTLRDKKGAADTNKKVRPTIQLPATIDEVDAVEDGKKDTDMKEATEN
ncbi:hypothetical protein N7447_006490 [Penicillium robsamsonii]|uniref:uncharacterized protein n=1 Tax=Penicillium robsamsonii TaxID=1792511 RepID=UPI0025499E49|nr:uncharacterized protein N7447_006490 [Penicillium robsamsonii]KAJ5824150.1 hypothetical protein N7447_006490 [Penicillium robsamsonii]